MWWNGFDRFELRHAHETAVRDVWQRMKASAVSLALDDHPMKALGNRPHQSGDRGDRRWCALDTATLVIGAKTFDVPINLFSLPEDKTLDDEI